MMKLFLAISLLAEKLKTSFSTDLKENTKSKSAVQYTNLKKAFALSDSLHLNSHGKKITREELYER